MNIKLVEEAEMQYLYLQAAVASGHLTSDRFEMAVEQIQLKDALGRCWLIDAQNGKWTVYNGEAWVPADPYRTLRRLALETEIPKFSTSGTILGIHITPPSKLHRAWAPPPPLRSTVAIETQPSRPSRSILRTLGGSDAESSRARLDLFMALLLLGLLGVLLLGILTSAEGLLH